MQSISVFLGLVIFTDFWWKIDNVNRTQRVYNLIHICSEPFICKV